MSARNDARRDREGPQRPAEIPVAAAPRANDRRRSVRVAGAVGAALVVGLVAVAVAVVANRDDTDSPSSSEAAVGQAGVESPVVDDSGNASATEANTGEVAIGDNDSAVESDVPRDEDVDQWETLDWLTPTFSVFGDTPLDPAFDLLIPSFDGNMYELSVPDGQWRRIRTPIGFGTQGISIGKTIVLGRLDGAGAAIVTRDDIARLPPGVWMQRPNTDEIFGAEWPSNSVSDVEPTFTRYSVDVVAGAAELIELPGEFDSGWFGHWSPAGWPLVERDDGVYELTDTGAEFVSTGSIVTATSTHTLFDVCDERGDCSFVVVDEVGTEVTLDLADVSALPADDAAEPPDLTGSPVMLSPDGRSLVSASFGPVRSDGLLIDIVTFDEAGNALAWTSVDRYFVPPSVVWLPDSSGLVLVEPQTPNLSVVQRSDGRVIDVELRFSPITAALGPRTAG